MKQDGSSLNNLRVFARKKWRLRPMANPEVALLISTYERPAHLRRVLASVACQQRVHHCLEVIVSDDGSRDETAELVREFADIAPFPVRYTSHAHDGFHLARVRNDGVRASCAPYLLFLDGDCLIPPDHIWQHLQRRRPRTVMGGYCLHLDQSATDGLDVVAVERGRYQQLVSSAERWRLRKMMMRARWYELIGHATKPKLYGGNIGMWRSDYESINGYDENFRGWGCEDDDLRLRLRADGISIRSILPWTHTYHLWHPKTTTTPERWRDGANVKYLLRNDRRTRCEQGLNRSNTTAQHLTPPHVAPPRVAVLPPIGSTPSARRRDG